MLYLIGLGLDKKDLTLKAVGALKKCRTVYLEVYTSYSPYSIAELKKLIGKEIIKADRELIEQKSEIILAAAKKQHAAVLVPGSPLSATTHVDLMMRAQKEGIAVQVIHGISVMNAIAETGLQLYKLGKTASIPRWQESFQPESFYEIMNENFSIKAHTLMLLDIGLEVYDALLCIKQISEKRNDGMINRNFTICSRAGTAKQNIKTGKITELMKEKFALPACIIALAPLHFLEAEMLGIKQEGTHDSNSSQNK